MDKVVEIGFGARTAQVYSFKSQSFWLGLHVCSTCRYMFVTSHIDDSLYTTYVTYVCCLYIQNDSKLLTPKIMVRITLNTQYEPKSWSQTITVKLWALGILMYLNVCIAMNHCNYIYIYELQACMYKHTWRHWHFVCHILCVGVTWPLSLVRLECAKDTAPNSEQKNKC